MMDTLEQAQIFIDLKRYADAAKLLRTLLSADPHHATALAYLAICQINQGQLPEAVRTAKLSNQQDVNYQALVVLAIAYFYQKNTKELQQICELGKAQFPYGYQFYEYEARLEKDKHRLRKATKIIEQGLKIAPSSPQLHNLHGEILELRSKTKKAKAAFDRALHLQPEHPQTHINQGWYALRKGHFQEAQHFFQTALRRLPADRSAQYGYYLSYKNELRWFRPFSRYIAYGHRMAPMILIGVLGGVASQAGQLGNLVWNQPSLFFLFMKIFIGVIILFWLPLALSVVASWQLSWRTEMQHIFGEEQRQEAILSGVRFAIVIFIWLVLMVAA